MGTTEIPRFAIRVTTFSGWSVFIMLLFSFLNYREAVEFNPYILITLSAILIVLGFPEFIRILKIRSKTESKLVTIVISIVVMLAVVTMLELNDRKIIIWNELYLSVPLLLFFIVLFCVSFIAEDKHFVRVYLSLDGFHYYHLMPNKENPHG